ncbi:MAG: [protein-PII] uridylyltransferase [Deltaproteobacteria bacterium]|nr:[protein-PII] uridylyltransferase [Deltaproteobacteria bacterium]
MNINDALFENLKTGAAAKEAAKIYLANAASEIENRHRSGERGGQLCKAYASMIDVLLISLFTVKARDIKPVGGNYPLRPLALVALGGYGREEMNVKSDIDLMLLYGGKITPEIERLTHEMLYCLWDTGLDIGFCIRTIDECITLARGDIKTSTALLDSRMLLGDSRLFKLLNQTVRKKLFSKKEAAKFIREKVEETRQRHSKYGGSVYILEPNVKEGEGGLRDIHTTRWIVQARFGLEATPVTSGFVTGGEYARLEESLDFLLSVRNELHFFTGRKSDQLTFDHQERIASLLGFKNTEHSLAVESFMQRYYMHASNINHLYDLILSRCLRVEEKKGFFWRKKKIHIDKNFNVMSGRLYTSGNEALSNDPAAIVKAFDYAQSFGVELDTSTVDNIIAALSVHGDGLYSRPEASETFMKILSGNEIYKTLVEMHRLKALDKLIPEFAGITCRVQHDMYHIYTVDVHTLFAVREIERLKGEYKSEHSLLATLFEETPNQAALVMAVLLHDIGKAMGKGHAEKGAAMATEICKRLGLTEDDTNTIKFLVKNHLILADTAQYRDIHDEKLVIEFAKKIVEIERLNLLYLLTFADVRAVGPDVWNQWKGTLIQELYFKTLSVLERGTFEPADVETRITAVKDKVIKLLRPEGINNAYIEEYFTLLPQRYFLSTHADFIAEHVKIAHEMGTKQCGLFVRQDTYRQYTELVVCTYDLHGLFSMITGVMAANAVNILGAQVNTLKNGMVIDVLQVNSSTGELISDPAKIKKIEDGLDGVIRGKIKVKDLVGKRRPSILDKKAKPRVKTRVLIDNDVSDVYTVVEIHAQNRIGLLYDITSTFTGLGLYIHIAKITTNGDEAADIFYIKDIFGQKIFYDARLKEISAGLYSAIEGAGDAGDGGGEKPGS